MTDDPQDRRKVLRSLFAGARLGLLAGVAVALLTWIAAGIIKVIITWPSLEWPAWFPSVIPEFILSGLWVAIVVVLFTVVGAAVGWLRPARYDLL